MSLLNQAPLFLAEMAFRGGCTGWIGTITDEEKTAVIMDMHSQQGHKDKARQLGHRLLLVALLSAAIALTTLGLGWVASVSPYRQEKTLGFNTLSRTCAGPVAAVVKKSSWSINSYPRCNWIISQYELESGNARAVNIG